MTNLSHDFRKICLVELLKSRRREMKFQFSLSRLIFTDSLFRCRQFTRAHEKCLINHTLFFLSSFSRPCRPPIARKAVKSIYINFHSKSSLCTSLQLVATPALLSHKLCRCDLDVATDRSVVDTSQSIASGEENFLLHLIFPHFHECKNKKHTQELLGTKKKPKDISRKKESTASELLCFSPLPSISISKLSQHDGLAGFFSLPLFREFTVAVSTVFQFVVVVVVVVESRM